MSGPIAVFVSVAILGGAVLWRSIQAHLCIEKRARVVELLARALARGRSLPLLFAKLNEEFPRHGLWAISCSLSDGASLADALDEANSPLFPAPWPDLVRAAEGDGLLAEVLGHEAQAEAHQGRFLEKLLLSLVYPAVLVFGVWALNQAESWASGYQLLYAGSDVEIDIGAVAIVLSLVGAFLALRFTQWPSWLPRPWRTARADRARILRVLSGVLDRGVPLHEALSRMEPLAMDRSLRSAVANAAVEAEAGEAAGTALSFLGKANHQKARIRGATSASLLDRLRAVAEQLEGRVRTQQQYLLSGIRPVAVVICGIFVLVGYASFMRWIVGTQSQAMPW